MRFEFASLLLSLSIGHASANTQTVNLEQQAASVGTQREEATTAAPKVPSQVISTSASENVQVPTAQPTLSARKPADLPIAADRTTHSVPPTNEFQRFVFASTGSQLTTFGEGFFSTPTKTFAPLDRSPVPAEYTIGPGDELYVRVWGTVDLDYRLVVDRNGQITLPRVGVVSVSGLKSSELHGHINREISRVFKGYSLNVTMGQLRSIQVFVVGNARQPGTYTIGSLSTLVNAVFASGGPGPNGSMRRVQLVRGNQVFTELDLYDFIINGKSSKDVQLRGGDVIVYPAAGPRVAVVGAVDTPAIFEINGGKETLAHLLEIAGARASQASLQDLHLDRTDSESPKSPRQVIRVGLPEHAGTLLKDGDILTVPPASLKFSNAVTLRGNVALPLRHQHKPGMRISDLIPEAEALIAKDYYIRKNRLVQFSRAQPGDTNPVNIEQINWHYATVERLSQDQLKTELISFDLKSAITQPSSRDNLHLLPGDIVTIYNERDLRSPQARGTRLIRIEGEVERPGIYQISAGETLRSALQRAGGLTSAAYVYGLEFSREETRQRQRENLAAAQIRLEAMATTQAAVVAANRQSEGNAQSSADVSKAATQAQLSKLSRIEPNGRIALELSPSASRLEDLPELPLENADRVFVPARPGFVTVAGAVVNNNAFLWRPERTAEDYIRIAGLDEGAELDNAFILRADGTISRSTSRFSWLGNTLNSEKLYPGDSIFVPSKLDYETWGRALIRNLKDWTSIFSQFGLGAAAIKTLK